VLVNNNQ